MFGFSCGPVSDPLATFRGRFLTLRLVGRVMMLMNPVLASAQRALAERKSNLIPSVNEPTIKAAATAKWDSRYAGAVPHDTAYYMKCVLGGAISCGSTHLAVTPLDVTKCNMQVWKFLCISLIWIAQCKPGYDCFDRSILANTRGSFPE